MDLELNQRFESYNAAYSYIQEWANRNNHRIKIERSYRLENTDKKIIEQFTYSYVTFACVHYGSPRKGKKDIRENTKSKKTNCPFHLKIKYDENNNCMFVYQMNLEHNHELITDDRLKQASIEMRKLNEEQIDQIKLLVKHKMPSKQLKGLIEEQYGKNLTDKDIQNLKAKILDKNNIPEDEKIEKILDDLKNNNTIVNFKKNEEDELEGIFIATKEQVNWFNHYAQMIHIDATYKVNKENFVLYVFLAQDSYKHGLPIAYCLLKSENRENMQFMYDTLEKHLHIDKIENIMIDKDLQNIDFLKEFFPKANILLCTFHVIKYLKVVTGKYESEENKQVIMDIIEDMVYADYVEEYQELLT